MGTSLFPTGKQRPGSRLLTAGGAWRGERGALNRLAMGAKEGWGAQAGPSVRAVHLGGWRCLIHRAGTSEKSRLRFRDKDPHGTYHL